MKLPLVSCVAVLALVGAACGGAGHARNASVDDLATIAEPPPPLPKGAYRQDNLDDPKSFSLAYLRKHTHTSAERRALAVLVDAGFEHGYQKAWAGEIGNDGGSANVAVFLFRDASRTSDVLASLQRILSEDVLEKSAETESVDASGLGQESSAIHADGDDEEIAYAWRTRNLVLVVDLLCFNQCDPADHFREVARAYADDVDARAEKVGG